jgi:hypothetical protein
VYPAATVQRCMVHVQRMVRLWLTRRPKLTASKELRFLAGLLHHIRNVVEQHMWVIAFEQWYKKYQHIIEEKVLHKPTGRWWYKHRSLRRSAVMIKKAVADMFHFIGDRKIPKTTNGLDSYFGHLKLNLNVHRGLSKEHRKAFILWYLYLKGRRFWVFLAIQHTDKVKKQPVKPTASFIVYASILLLAGCSPAEPVSPSDWQTNIKIVYQKITNHFWPHYLIWS